MVPLRHRSPAAPCRPLAQSLEYAHTRPDVSIAADRTYRYVLGSYRRQRGQTPAASMTRRATGCPTRLAPPRPTRGPRTGQGCLMRHQVGHSAGHSAMHHRARRQTCSSEAWNASHGGLDGHAGHSFALGWGNDGVAGRALSAIAPSHFLTRFPFRCTALPGMLWRCKGLPARTAIAREVLAGAVSAVAVRRRCRRW
jgi:hypothetical protein